MTQIVHFMLFSLQNSHSYGILAYKKMNVHLHRVFHPQQRFSSFERRCGRNHRRESTFRRALPDFCVKEH